MRKFWGALSICRSKIGYVKNSFHILHIFESPQPRDCPWRGFATQEADQELKWKLRTLSVWEFLGPQSWDTKRTPLPRCYNTSQSPDLIGLTYENIFIRSTLSEDNQSMVHTTNKTSSNPCLGSTKDTKMFWILYSSNFYCEWQSLLHFCFWYQFTE